MPIYQEYWILSINSFDLYCSILEYLDQFIRSHPTCMELPFKKFKYRIIKEYLLATYIFQLYQLVAKYSLQPSRNKFRPKNCWYLKSVGKSPNYWLVLHTLYPLCLWCSMKILIEYCCILLLFPLPFFHLSLISSSLLSSIKNPINPFYIPYSSI